VTGRAHAGGLAPACVDVSSTGRRGQAGDQDQRDGEINLQRE